MDGFESINDGDKGQGGLAEAMRYAAAGMGLFPVSACRAPLTAHGSKDASSNPEVIKAWRRKWAHCEFGWAVPAGVVVVDVDRKNGKDGYSDFRDRAGCDPHSVATPQATTPSGGLHLVYAATKTYRNLVGIEGTGIDTRTQGGYVVLPLPGNGREWLRQLIGADGAVATLLPAPAWLDCALRQAPSTRAPLVLSPAAALVPASSDPWAQKNARAQLERACAKIVAAAPGTQDSTRHAQCFYIGGLIARGDLGYEEAYAALLEAARAMPAYRDPWRNLETRVVANELRAAIGGELFEDHNLFRERVTAALKAADIKLPAADLKQIMKAVSWREPTAAPVIAKLHKPGKIDADPLRGLYATNVGGKPAVVEYEPDSDLRDTEQVPLLEEGGIEAFFRREVLPYTPDAWIDDSATKVGYEISFTRHFYKPVPLRTLDEIRADIRVTEKEAEGLLDEVLEAGVR